jgi:hypothetical protein
MGGEEGEDGSIYHALNTEAGTVHLAARGILKGLQSHGGEDVPLRRYMVDLPNQRGEYGRNRLGM